jgi:hypothetical protein
MNVDKATVIQNQLRDVCDSTKSLANRSIFVISLSLWLLCIPETAMPQNNKFESSTAK